MFISSKLPGNNLAKNKLSLAISVALFPLMIATSMTTQAAEQTKADTETIEKATKKVAAKADETEVIEVTGFRSSASQQRWSKRNSDNISDSIFAEDMGKMPDANIAEAMQRITGVGISRVDGEGSEVTIRGIDPSLNVITLNGQVMTNGGDDNAVDLSTMSADMLKSIEVIKSPSADHDEGSLGGSILLKTARPLQAKKRKISASVQLKSDELADEQDVAVNLGFIDSVNDSFGVAFSLFYDEKSTRQDYFTSTQWDIFDLTSAHSAQTGKDLGSISSYEPKQFDLGIKFNERVRLGGGVTFEYLPDDISSLVLDMSYTKKFDDSLSHQTRVSGMRNDTIYDEVSGSTVVASANANGNQLSRLKEVETDTTTLSLAYDREFGDWLFTTKLGYSLSEASDVLNRRISWKVAKTEVTTSWLDENGSFYDIPTTQWHNDSGWFDPAQMELNTFFDNGRDVKDELSSISVDIERDLDFGPLTAIKFGAKYFERAKDTASYQGTIKGKTVNGGDKVYLDQHSLDFPVDDFFHGVADNVIPGFDVPNFDEIYDTYLPDGHEPIVDPNKTSLIETEAAAAYVKLNYAWFDDRLLGDFGVRAVNTKISAAGHGGINYPDEILSAPINEENDYTNILPSFNGRFIINEEMVLRFSAAQVMARPAFTEVRPGFVFQATSNVLRGNRGNPKLDAFEANQFDISWEWYYGETGMVSVAAFYKDITSFIYATTTELSQKEVFGDQFGTGPCPEYLDTLPDDADPDAAELCRRVTDVPVRGSSNGSNGTVQGVELSYQQDFTFLPGFLSDFGVVTNYTYTDSEAPYSTEEEGSDVYFDGFPFLNTSKDTFNGTLYWEKSGHSLRLAYNYRSPRLTNAVVLESSQWTDSRESLDFSGQYELTKQIKLTFAATNLTNESNRTFVTRTVGQEGEYSDGTAWSLPGEGNALTGNAPDWRTASYKHNGRTYRIGITARF